MTQRGSVEGKVAIVTGAASGIGRATALLLAENGASLALADIDGAALAETAHAVANAGSEPEATVLDVTDGAAVDRFVQATVDHFGGLDAAFNNAAIEGAGAPLIEISDDDWRRVLEVDLTSVFLCMRAQLNAILAAGGGSIVNTASSLGLVGTTSQAAYVTAKHGVVGLTRAAALDYADRGVRVNCVCPGLVDTPMLRRSIDADPAIEGRIVSRQPVGRLGVPAEIGEAVLWLCSDASSFVTGHTLVVDGGYVVN